MAQEGPGRAITDHAQQHERAYAATSIFGGIGGGMAITCAMNMFLLYHQLAVLSSWNLQSHFNGKMTEYYTPLWSISNLGVVARNDPKS